MKKPFVPKLELDRISMPSGSGMFLELLTGILLPFRIAIEWDGVQLLIRGDGLSAPAVRIENIPARCIETDQDGAA